jgi:methyl-accepting chemotaxis protein
MSGYADTKAVASYLAAPAVDSGVTFADQIAEQGPQIKAVNWIWEHVTGENLIEALIAPVTGDWARIAANGEAWRNVGNALEQVSGNLSDNVGKLHPYWGGEAAQAFRRHIEMAWFAGLYAEGAVAKTIAKGFEFVAEQSERLCHEAFDLITKLVHKLVSAAATFAIPIVGEARAIKLVWDAYQIYQAIKGIYEAIKATINVLSQLLEALGNISAALESIKDVRNLSNLAELGQELNANTSDVHSQAQAVRDNTSAAREHLDAGRQAAEAARHR